VDLDELRDALLAERRQDSLQALRESFYAEADEYVTELRERRDAAAAASSDPFSDPEVRRLSDEIDTAEEVRESLYERRIGKVVDRASFAAAGDSHGEGGLTEEERALFDDLVARIRENRAAVLGDGAATDGADAGSPSPSPSEPEPEPEPEPGPTHEPDTDPGSAADDGRPPDPNDLLAEAMGGEPAATDADAGSEPDPGPAADDDRTPAPPDADAPAGDRTEPAPDPGSGSGSGSGSEPAPEREPTPTAAAGGGGGTADRRRVYVTRDVGEILGVDDRTYRLAAEDVVDLPAENAEALLARDAAEPLS
jgi:DNA replication factor GINS